MTIKTFEKQLGNFEYRLYIRQYYGITVHFLTYDMELWLYRRTFLFLEDPS